VAHTWSRAGKTNAERPFGSTDEFVEWLANQAVKDAWEQHHVRLDYSVESIKNVDQILGNLDDQYTKDRSTISVRGLGLTAPTSEKRSGEANLTPVASATMRWVKSPTRSFGARDITYPGP
jgi:hypothetical protein